MSPFLRLWRARPPASTIARCSAKVASGYTLDEVLNEITGVGVLLEPALDYCAVKVPRFELEKFPLPCSALGTQMRSVGEALAMGRTALEALNKGIRASERKFEGLTVLDERNGHTLEDVDRLLHSAHPLRLMAAYTVLKQQGAAKTRRSITHHRFRPLVPVAARRTGGA